jgi:hypothetical protein
VVKESVAACCRNVSVEAGYMRDACHLRGVQPLLWGSSGAGDARPPDDGLNYAKALVQLRQGWTDALKRLE